MDNFSIAHKFTLSWEGGESDDAADSGGFTKFGVSTAFLTDIASTQAGRDVLERMGVRQGNGSEEDSTEDT